MSTLAEELRQEEAKPPPLPGRILTFDIETQRAIVEVWRLGQEFVPIDCIVKAARVLCLSAKWHDEDRMIFVSDWKDDAEVFQSSDSYVRMMTRIFNLLSEASIVVTWNGDRFDLQWVEEECGRLGLGRPVPYQTVDLFKVARRRFRQGLMSMKLDFSARSWLRDQKIQHDGRDLWWDIRHGTRAEMRSACKLMREYCEHDTELTEYLFNDYLPWLPINLALRRDDIDSELLFCTKCGQTGHLTLVNSFYYTNAFGYNMFQCSATLPNGKICGGFSKGKRAKVSTELRSV